MKNKQVLVLPETSTNRFRNIFSDKMITVTRFFEDKDERQIVSYTKDIPTVVDEIEINEFQKPLYVFNKQYTEA